MADKSNPSIRCTVQQCSYHNDSKDHCTLDTITIGTHESSPSDEQCTDCKSFALK